MLKTRIITAFALVAGLVAAVLFTTTTTWALITLLIALLAMNEWSNLVRLKNGHRYSMLMIMLLSGLLIAFMHVSPLYMYQHVVTMTILALSVLFWLIIAPIWLFTRKPCSSSFLMSVLGLFLILAIWIALVGLHAIHPILLLGAIATVSIADSAAYFAGKTFGRHKLAPEISPGKTWEGVFGALLAVTLYGVALWYVMGFGLWVMICLWLLVALGIIGDLTESLLKRRADIKDSGQLLPGHGGILDRIDGLMPALPMTLFIIYLSFIAGYTLHG